MPRAELSLARIGRLLGRKLPLEELTERLFASKAQVEGGHGDTLEVEGTPDRLDLLTEAGLALHLQGVLGLASGRPPLGQAGPHDVRIEVDPSVDPLRPSIAAIVLDPPEGETLDQDLLDEAVRFQELLHATIGLDRRLASLGIYPAERLRAPIRYALEPIDRVRFVPLDEAAEVDAEAFFSGHPMAQRFGALGRSGDRCLTLRDAGGAILSLPPILNSRSHGEARPGDGRLLIESTGTRPARVHDALGLLVLPFAARGWRAGPVPVARGAAKDPGTAIVAPRSARLTAGLLERLAGLKIPEAEVVDLLGRCRFDVHPERSAWLVEAAPWRADLHAPVDIAEDVLLARGVRPDEAVVPPSWTRGGRSASAKFRYRVAELLLGLGLVPLYTPVLIPERVTVVVGRTDALAVTNPVSDQFARLRDSLLPSLVGVLERNVRHGYPQRCSEIGPVVRRMPGSESGAETRFHAALVLAEERAGFADAAALVDYVMRSLGAVGVREPVTIPGTIPGRAAAVRLAGVPVAEIGEIAPAVLHEIRVPVPAVWAEWDLTAMEGLLSPEG